MPWKISLDFRFQGQKPRIYVCGYCKRGYNRKDSLISHMRKNEECRINTNFVDIRRKQPGLCLVFYGEIFSSVDRIHAVRSDFLTGVTQFHCELCDKYYTAYASLYRHKKMHENGEIDRFYCDLCQTSFVRSVSKQNLSKCFLIFISCQLTINSFQGEHTAGSPEKDASGIEHCVRRKTKTEKDPSKGANCQTVSSPNR